MLGRHCGPKVRRRRKRSRRPGLRGEKTARSEQEERQHSSESMGGTDERKKRRRSAPTLFLSLYFPSRLPDAGPGSRAEGLQYYCIAFATDKCAGNFFLCPLFSLRILMDRSQFRPGKWIVGAVVSLFFSLLVWLVVETFHDSAAICLA